MHPPPVASHAGRFLAAGLAVLAALGFALGADEGPKPTGPPAPPSKDLLAELQHYRHKIVHESNRDGNWELYLVNADGSNPVNLTRTPDVDEVYPKPSPDGTRICFVGDRGRGRSRVRDVYVMNSDGSGRIKIADNAREPCWSPDGQAIAYLKGEYQRYNLSDFATKGLYIYDLQTGKTRQHPNHNLHHLYTLNWVPGGKWFVSTVHGGMGFQHAIIAFEADGDRVVDLHLEGCRPNISPDGKKITWGHGDFCAGVADLNFDTDTPRATNIHNVVENHDPIETYHVTWSPDGKYVTYTRGPKHEGKNLENLLPEFPGVEAPGWDVCVADAHARNRWVPITHDGKSNKQPSWVVVREGAVP
jgi:Tol biopolymer transport system component